MSDDPQSFRDDERFRKAERLRQREEFLETHRSGERASSEHFVVYGRPNTAEFARLGITASTKVGNATVRNWWKRQIREIFRRNKREFPGGFDFVVIVKASAERAAPADLEEELIDVLNRVADEATDE